MVRGIGRELRITGRTKHVKGPARSVVIIAIAVVVLVIGAVIVALALSPKESHFAPNSPEAAFQHYVDTYNSRDFNEAYRSFSTGAQRQLTLDQYVTQARSSAHDPINDNQRIVIGKVEHQGSIVLLHLTIEHSGGSGLDFDHFSDEQTVPMIQENGLGKLTNSCSVPRLCHRNF